MSSLIQILVLIGSLDVDDMPDLLHAVLQAAKEEDVVAALKQTHPSLVDSGE